ncbi:RNA-directed DNA polymerase-like protein [Gossypium australe]|uniref:RNA-directed DNA polymerase-like protein n=1 Tax=Gossypium australe TaxID=47621 RepID=A0A5B6VZQ6_9ROSI|nr:RNA-directed DNA polymerase-like protein [Gossypium australe]
MLSTGFIREVVCPDWVSNIVMMKKANGKWRMYIDFTSLNKACPNDSFPLPSVDKLVDASSSLKFMSFMDAFSSYNQISMAQEDQDKIAFVKKEGLFFYRVMPFELKNAGATYQRLVNKIFKKQIARNVEVYVDDMLVKNSTLKGHIQNLNEWQYRLSFDFQTFNNVAEYEALILGLQLAPRLRVKELIIYIDSQFVAKQMNDEYEVKKPSLKKYHAIAVQLLAQFDKA